ncbi:TIR domain-containing protein [Acidimicrobiaceae bacterium USS-CC1]|uniref:TIR domain-containing protein n=1 Tax=Acidiferrimicrobium australe TaxID=2664430 RepID=A0ABW9QNC3_9ACTN|nr:TIR domain-containing protein [Acidiferrimicrobium australe]
MTVEEAGSASEAKAWVEANRSVVEEAYRRFAKTGEWPGAAELQRHFDQRAVPVDVQKAIDSKPSVGQEGRLPHADRLVLAIRHMMWLSSASTLVDLCFEAVVRSVTSYLSETDTPGVTSIELAKETSASGTDLARVYSVLTREHPSPFGGSSQLPDGQWRIEADSRFARRFRDLNSIESFVERQDIIRAEAATEMAALLALPQFRTPLSPYAEPSARVDETAESPEPVLFVSWGRPASKAIARALVPVLESRLPGVEIFFSPTSIEPGADPSRRMFDEGLLRSSALVVVLTSESAESPYVIWETATAWARDQLVIPVFVDIEPGRVPGPLTSKVQGVKFGERSDLDRALNRLAAQFGSPPSPPLSEEEYTQLVAAAEIVLDVDPKLARRALLDQLRGYLARWQVLYESLEGHPSVDERVRLAAEVEQVLGELLRAAVTTGDDPALATALSALAKEATAVRRTRVLLDGGRSFRQLDDGCRSLLERIAALLEP